MTDPIRMPCAAMVGITALVWVKLYADRLDEMRAMRIDPQSLATARVAAGALHCAIHVTYNRVVHRFLAYATSTLLLLGMWIALFARIAR